MQKNCNYYDKELILSIIEAKNRLENSILNYETSDVGLVDYYAYQIKADKAKLDYLIKKVKEKNISLSMLDELKLRLNERLAV